MNAVAPLLFQEANPSTVRILATAHEQLLAHGYTALTMDALAHELGMSKKTLYVHFPGKDALIERIIDALSRTLRVRMDAVLNDPKLSFPERARALVEIAGSTLARMGPLLRELQRFSPRLYEKIEVLRGKNIPYVFGRLIRDGIIEGKVRTDVDPEFACEFWLQAIRGLMQPAVLERAQLTPRQTLEKALGIFLRGLLTPNGRKDYEKLLAP